MRERQPDAGSWPMMASAKRRDHEHASALAQGPTGKARLRAAASERDRSTTAATQAVRPSPAWITPLQPDVEAGVNVEMDARPFVQSRFYERAMNVHSCQFADVGELSLSDVPISAGGRLRTALPDQIGETANDASPRRALPDRDG